MQEKISIFVRVSIFVSGALVGFALHAGLRASLGALIDRFERRYPWLFRNVW